MGFLGRATATLIVFLLAGCGLTTTQSLEDIDPLSLPGRLVRTPAPTPSVSAEPVAADGSVYFVRDGRLVERMRMLSLSSGPAAVQELLDSLAAGPDAADRDNGMTSALPPAVVLRLTSLTGDIATVDLILDQLPQTQTSAIAQIVLTVTSLAEVNGLKLTINGAPISAPLASGAQTDRPLTRADYVQMLGNG